MNQIERSAMLFDSSKHIGKSPRCPDCDIELEFLVARQAKRIFVSTILERRFFLCPNCQRLIHQLVTMPIASSGAEV
jgi:uncharacterized protein with PIN domain